jgi:4-hydroxybenzoate polyprenyltransferase/phosphoserine phosphatase
MSTPLVVDLDGTLLRTDLLAETALAFAQQHPWRVASIFSWLMQGKRALKQQLALHTDIDVSSLPYDDRVIALIKTERATGRTIVLATASDQGLAERIAEHLGLFDAVLGTDQINLAGHNKRDALLQRYAETGFDYLGNSSADLPVWAAAKQALIINASSAVVRQAQLHGNVQKVIATDSGGFKTWLRAMRLHQWVKNLLIFVPLIAAHRAQEIPLLIAALTAFVCFGLCASSVYLLNDLIDLSDDRFHPRKRSRPFAAGHLSILSGLSMVPVLLLAAFALALWRLPLVFAIGLATYYLLTLAYSLVLKRIMVIDVATLAGLYTLRIIVGGIALGIPLSFWLLAFSVFMFLSLALVKRYAELFQNRARGETGKARGRGYYPDDLPMIGSLGAASGYIAVMVLALYINEAHTRTLYQQPIVIWLACPLLLIWISRVWMLAHRGEMNEDPVVFAMRDWVSLLIGAFTALVFWIAT